MKRYIRNSKYLTDNSDVLFDDSILVDIDVDLSSYVMSSNNDSTLFPGVEQFKNDVLKILEQEYKFDVIEDNYDGVLQKGYVSNRDGSASIYFDTYFDLSNAQYAIDRLGVKQPVPKDGKVFCFIHIRFSDHNLNDGGDSAHLQFVNENAKKYTENNPKVTHVIKDESIEVSERQLHRYYDAALDELKIELDSRILSWIRKADKYRRKDV